MRAGVVVFGPAQARHQLQIAELERTLRQNGLATAIMERAGQLELPGWYLGAGAVAQTVWNELHGFGPTYGIKDYNLVYFDRNDLSVESEKIAEQRAAVLFDDLDIKLDLTNEARVHLWYQKRFGRSIPRYRSSEDAIATWPTTATSIGVRVDRRGFVVSAPFGLDDLFAMIVRPNKAIIDTAIYELKVARWRSTWPRLKVIPW